MDIARVLSQRLATQRLASAPLPSATEAVRLLTCVQSQERDHAFFSLGLRTRRSTYVAVRGELDAGTFVRTHILRPTWHFVAREDLRWILSLTSPRVLASMAGRHRQLGLDEPQRVDDGFALLSELLQGRHFLTRQEIGETFGERGSPVRPGEQLGHLLMVAELQGLVCSGPVKGVHHSYALVDEVVPPIAAMGPVLDPDEAHRELVRRFFAGHGPANVKDFTRWSSLTVAGTRTALADLGDVLEQVDVDGTPHWFDPTVVSRRSSGAPAAYLFPTYDEVVLSYRTTGFPAAPDHPYAKHPDPFWAEVVLDQRNVGIWKRAVKGEAVEVDVRLARSVDEAGRVAVGAAAHRLADFLGKALVPTEATGELHGWT